MSPPARLAAFALAGALAFGGGAALGAAFPVDQPERQPADQRVESGVGDHPHTPEGDQP